MKGIIITLLFTIVNLSHAIAGDIEAKDLKLFRGGDKISLSFSAYIPEKMVRTDRRMLITPQLYNDNGVVSLDLFTITGKQMEKREKQKKILKKNTAISDHINVANGSTLLYTTTFSYEAWMNDKISLRLLIKEDGCCETTDLGVIMDWGAITLPLISEPSLSKVLPVASQVTQLRDRYPFLCLIGTDGEGGRSPSVRFKGADSRLDLSFSSNGWNVEKIMEGIRLVNNDERTRLEKVTIVGFASPEGGLKYNLELSESRAIALSQYLQQEMKLPASIFEIRSRGEDWEGLLELVRQSDMQYKEDIIYIINREPAEKRNSLLKQLGGGRPYQSMYDLFYPQLRDACYINVWYSEKEDEAAEIINKAIGLITTSHYDEALKSLSTVENDSRSWNAIGSCYILQGNYSQARVWLQKAVEAGDKDAKKNLDLIK